MMQEVTKDNFDAEVLKETANRFWLIFGGRLAPIVWL